MSTQEIILSLKEKNAAKLAKAQEAVVAVEAEIKAIEELEAAIASEVKAEGEKSYDEGLAQAGQAGGSDKIYSDAEMNQFLADAKAEKQVEIDTLKAKLETLEATPVVDVDAKVKEALASQLSEFRALVHETQAEENAVESKLMKFVEVKDAAPSESVY